MFKNLPNQLTLGRIFVIPVIIVLLSCVEQAWAAWLALILFVVAALTDLLDGWVARRYEQTSRLGQFLDPIADKLLVAAVILLLVSENVISGLSILPAVIILLREVAVSGLREFLAELRVSLPVSQMAKWKTTIQFFALAFLIIGDHAPSFVPAYLLGHMLLWVAGVLTVITAWDYWRASVKHFEQTP